MRKKLLVTLAALLLSSGSSAQTGLDLMDVDLMFVGAHPDDDGGVMATFARYILDQGFKATVLTATGGDGGGNAIGPEAGRSLALIRVEEERREAADFARRLPEPVSSMLESMRVLFPDSLIRTQRLLAAAAADGPDILVQLTENPPIWATQPGSATCSRTCAASSPASIS